MIHADTTLIEAARSGDPTAIERLLAVSQPDLRRFARRTCTTSEDAEDAVQVALWRLRRRIGTLRKVATFASWLFRIVERECYRLLHLRHRWSPVDPVELEAITAPPSPLGLRSDLAAAIAALPVLYRTVLLLRDVDGMTTAEVAAWLGITPEAVKSRLHRARTLMREALTAGGYWNDRATAPAEHLP